MPPRALCFVDMPFGRKTDLGSGTEIDFDRIYAIGIRPAIVDAGLEPLRGDEERTGGIIHSAMFARLLDAEYMVADLTLGNANVFYELGVRHAARPHATVPIFAAVSGLPFDVSLVRAIGYQLDKGQLNENAAATLRTALTARLRAAPDQGGADSPIFQLFPRYPGVELPPDVRGALQDRLRLEQGFRDSLQQARSRSTQADRRQALRDIEATLDPRTVPRSVLVDLLLSYRAEEAWPEMVALCERFPERLRRVTAVRQQWALALNRRRQPGDRDRAVSLLNALLQEQGPDPETLGILGRAHKDRYAEAKARGNITAAAALDDAIEAYAKGFEADPRDYYPGINAITLLVEKGDAEALKRAERLAPAVAFAVERQGGVASKDYWVLATALELAAIRGDWADAARALPRVVAAADEAWTADSTAGNLDLLRQALTRRGTPLLQLDEIIAALRARAGELRGGKDPA